MSQTEEQTIECLNIKKQRRKHINRLELCCGLWYTVYQSALLKTVYDSNIIYHQMMLSSGFLYSFPLHVSHVGICGFHIRKLSSIDTQKQHTECHKINGYLTA